MTDKNNNGSLIFTVDSFEKDPDLIAAVLSHLKFFPYQSEYDEEVGMFYMLGFSRQFRSLKIGESAPFYSIDIYKDKSGQFLSAKVTEMEIDMADELKAQGKPPKLPLSDSEKEDEWLHHNTDTSVPH